RGIPDHRADRRRITSAIARHDHRDPFRQPGPVGTGGPPLVVVTLRRLVPAARARDRAAWSGSGRDALAAPMGSSPQADRRVRLHPERLPRRASPRRGGGPRHTWRGALASTQARRLPRCALAALSGYHVPPARRTADRGTVRSGRRLALALPVPVHQPDLPAPRGGVLRTPLPLR